MDVCVQEKVVHSCSQTSLYPEVPGANVQDTLVVGHRRQSTMLIPLSVPPFVDIFINAVISCVDSTA